jgi:hypothetical protein
MPQETPYKTSSEITAANRRDHWLARAGINRNLHRVRPGLYALGSPGREAEVFVTANYSLSFDALRSALKGIDAFILVLDTHGVNVWCAAGKGSFGTAELVRRIADCQLKNYIQQRKLVLPQLGATGVSAHLLKDQCGFTVEYGPVRAEDLPDYLKTHQATPAMRTMRFNLADRLVLAPVEMVTTLLPMAGISAVMYLLGGWFNLLWGLAGWLAATLLFFILLPWLPTREFSTKGFILGVLVALPFAFWQFLQPNTTFLYNLMHVLPMGLVLTAAVAFYALNLTGSTPITSWTSVRKEIFRYVPVMAVMAVSGIILEILNLFGLVK